MSLSKAMVAVILENGKFHAGVKETRDGRTIRALQRRKLIRTVRYHTTTKMWRWRFSAKGVGVSYQLARISPHILKELIG